jgi:hypothetical protein
MTGPGRMPGVEDQSPALRRRVWSSRLYLKVAKVYFLGSKSGLNFPESFILLFFINIEKI